MAPILLSPSPAMGAPLLQKCQLCPLGARISPPKRTAAGSSESSRGQSCPCIGANHVAVTEMLEKSVLRPSAHPRETWSRQARWKLSTETAPFWSFPALTIGFSFLKSAPAVFLILIHHPGVLSALHIGCGSPQPPSGCGHLIDSGCDRYTPDVDNDLVEKHANSSSIIFISVTR